ncbi:hypothetical protein B0T24DRAFT_633081 [Lasiosphaeria ovina]|uniref:DUF7932 domain-containing protein n=1 Tax=Lasiosphaeria ovina TaxID=92902 RepID=A0AAE0K4Z3_9PEZI|nr:hypothetical protein B0T24DRAFT_633081 [Lasiosphaeria ovina]
MDECIPGPGGPPGRGEINVIQGDGSVRTYPSRYRVEVVSFDVHDEGDDGINEPGEHLIVSNIVVTNNGQMPTPRVAQLHLTIRRSKWLTPVFMPLELPSGIQPGESVTVPGVLWAMINNETAGRVKGTLLHAKEIVSLRAFSQRLEREVPEFAGGCEVLFQYPLLMTAPRYLDCVIKGTTVKFSWSISNISSKPHGRTELKPREAGTSLSDPSGMFHLERAHHDTPHEVTDLIDVLEPGEKMPVMVELHVSDVVNEFTTGTLAVILQLADPHTGMSRPVVTFDLRIQVSPPYRYNPASRALLVINAQSNNPFVLQILNFIETGLHLPVDVFNLSLNGSMKLSETRQSVLPNYAGKSVIIFGNTMNHFQNGAREPWELLDMAETFALARGGTSFLVVAPTNIPSLKTFAHMLLVPGSGPSQDPAAGETIPTAKEIAQKLATMSPIRTSITLPVKKMLMRSMNGVLTSAATSTQEMLADKFPLRQFVVSRMELDAPADAPDDGKKKSKPKDGGLSIVEGLPQSAKLFATLQQFSAVQNEQGISEYNVAVVTHLLPFRDQCAIFWNLAGRETARGVSVGVAYAGNALGHLRSGYDAQEAEQFVSGKACEAISWSIATQLSSELSYFCAGSGAGGPSSGLLAQLPLLDYFVSSAPVSLHPAPGAAGTAEQIFAPLLNILGNLRAVTSPLSIGQSLGQHLTGPGQRRKKLNAMVVEQVAEPLVNKLLAIALNTTTTAPASPLSPSTTLLTPPPSSPSVSESSSVPELKRKKSARFTLKLLGRKSKAPPMPLPPSPSATTVGSSASNESPAAITTLTKTKTKSGAVSPALLTKNKSLTQAVADIEKDAKKRLADIKQSSPQLTRVARAHALACGALGSSYGGDGQFLDLLMVNQGTASILDIQAAGKDKQTTVVIMLHHEWATLHGQLAQRRAQLEGDEVAGWAKLAELMVVSPAGRRTEEWEGDWRAAELGVGVERLVV